ncbi:5-oxoprolinase subunit C family protein [Streptomonospora litoralis]|uniref:KipI antagonist n=1 Tax=Streptomonospora litoralis TaxID=2498135 RepID=A0A4P6Q785_9ACTN|nr:biotin-dependent carboxyltransferase family protein [Streptomonospora litoralis]QBI54794.1 KipI antagonist [Streptomonospora litoralis]
MAAVEVVRTGVLTTVQDGGRRGHAALGVGASGAADRASYALANRLLANPEGAAALEVTMGGLTLRARGTVAVAVTGAPCPVTVDGRGAATDTVLHLGDGAELRLEAPCSGLRSYVAARGGFDTPIVLGSRSTDTLAGLGPPRPEPGTVLRIGPPPRALPAVDWVPTRPFPADELSLRVVPGPRDDWFTDDALDVLLGSTYEVTARSDRIGARLTGPLLHRRGGGELPSEGMVPGSLQVPPEGNPVLFLADHPVTGGYPVIAVVVAADVARAAQARPGARLRFHL